MASLFGKLKISWRGLATTTGADMIPSAERQFSLDSSALALFRMGLGLLVFIEGLVRSQYALTFYSDLGLVPRKLVLSGGVDDWSLFFLNGSPAFAQLLFILMMTSGLALVLGVFTFRANLVAFLLMSSTVSRNPHVINGGELLLRLALLWSLWTPLNMRWSLDSYLRKRLKAEDSSTVATNAPVALKDSLFTPGTFALTLQIALVYLFAGVAKLGSEAWLTGRGVELALKLPHYQGLLGRWLATFDPDYLEILNYLVIVAELAIPILILSPFWRTPCRVLAFFVILALHILFQLSFELFLFGVAPIVLGTVLLPGELLSWIGQRIRRVPTQAISALGRGQRVVAEDDPEQGGLTEAVVAAVSWALVSFLLIFSFASAVEGLRTRSAYYRSFVPEKVIPNQLEWIGNLFNVRQSWDMFVTPGKFVRWAVVEGTTFDNRQIDLLTGGLSVSTRKPKDGLFPGAFWRSYFLQLASKRGAHLRVSAGRFFCHQWNTRAPKFQEVIRVRVISFSQQIKPSKSIAGRQRYSVLSEQMCNDLRET